MLFDWCVLLVVCIYPDCQPAQCEAALPIVFSVPRHQVRPLASRSSTSRGAIRGITISVSGRPHVIQSVLVASDRSEMRGAKSEVGVGGGETVKDQTNDAHHSYADGYVENKIIPKNETKNPQK